MNRKHIVIAVVVAAIVAVAVIFFARPTGQEPAIPTGGDSVDPAQAAMSDDASFASPVDRAARWGFVLYDDIKMKVEASVPGARGPEELVLQTGDQIYLGETDDAHKGQTRVTLFNGLGGWVDNSKFFEATTFAPWNILDTSTAPLKDWIPEELVTPANIPQYRVVISSDFLMRASKNPNPTIAEWAQAVLAKQAENAGQ